MVEEIRVPDIYERPWSAGGMGRPDWDGGRPIGVGPLTHLTTFYSLSLSLVCMAQDPTLT